MKNHHSPLEYVSPNKRRRSNAIRKDDGRERQLTVSNQQQQSDSSSVCCWMDYESIQSMQRFSSSTTHDTNKSSPCTINTQIASSTTTEIFLSRLHKEIVLPFRFTLASQIQLLDSDQSVHDATERRNVIQKRVLFGYNDVSKLLFDSNIGKTMKPSLIVVVNPENFYRNDSQQQPSSTTTIGAAMLQHIPLLSFHINVPLLLLPSSYSSENQPHRGGVETFTTQAIATIFGCGHHNNYQMNHFSCLAFTQQQDQSQRLRFFDSVVSKVVTDDNVLEHTQEQHLRNVHNAIDSFVNFIIDKVQN